MSTHETDSPEYWRRKYEEEKKRRMQLEKEVSALEHALVEATGGTAADRAWLAGGRAPFGESEGEEGSRSGQESGKGEEESGGGVEEGGERVGGEGGEEEVLEDMIPPTPPGSKTQEVDVVEDEREGNGDVEGVGVGMEGVLRTPRHLSMPLFDTFAVVGPTLAEAYLTALGKNRDVAAKGDGKRLYSLPKAASGSLQSLSTGVESVVLYSFPPMGEELAGVLPSFTFPSGAEVPAVPLGSSTSMLRNLLIPQPGQLQRGTRSMSLVLPGRAESEEAKEWREGYAAAELEKDRLSSYIASAPPSSTILYDATTATHAQVTLAKGRFMVCLRFAEAFLPLSVAALPEREEKGEIEAQDWKRGRRRATRRWRRAGGVGPRPATSFCLRDADTCLVVPRMLCFISRYPFFPLHHAVLAEIARRAAVAVEAAAVSHFGTMHRSLAAAKSSHIHRNTSDATTTPPSRSKWGLKSLFGRFSGSPAKRSPPPSTTSTPPPLSSSRRHTSLGIIPSSTSSTKSSPVPESTSTSTDDVSLKLRETTDRSSGKSKSSASIASSDESSSSDSEDSEGEGGTGEMDGEEGRKHRAKKDGSVTKSSASSQKSESGETTTSSSVSVTGIGLSQLPAFLTQGVLLLVRRYREAQVPRFGGSIELPLDHEELSAAIAAPLPHSPLMDHMSETFEEDDSSSSESHGSEEERRTSSSSSSPRESSTSSIDALFVRFVRWHPRFALSGGTSGIEERGVLRRHKTRRGIRALRDATSTRWLSLDRPVPEAVSKVMDNFVAGPSPGIRRWWRPFEAVFLGPDEPPRGRILERSAVSRAAVHFHTFATERLVALCSSDSQSTARDVAARASPDGPAPLPPIAWPLACVSLVPISLPASAAWAPRDDPQSQPASLTETQQDEKDGGDGGDGGGGGGEFRQDSSDLSLSTGVNISSQGHDKEVALRLVHGRTRVFAGIGSEPGYPEADASMIDWCLPVLLSLVPSDVIVLVLGALLTERSVVVVGSGLPDDALASSVLALSVLVRPLRWVCSVLPIVPQDAIDLLDSPVPILAGIRSLPPGGEENPSAVIPNAVIFDLRSARLLAVPESERIIDGERVLVPGYLDIQIPHQSEMCFRADADARCLYRKGPGTTVGPVGPVFYPTQKQIHAARGFAETVRAHIVLSVLSPLFAPWIAKDAMVHAAASKPKASPKPVSTRTDSEVAEERAEAELHSPTGPVAAPSLSSSDDDDFEKDSEDEEEGDDKDGATNPFTFFATSSSPSASKGWWSALSEDATEHVVRICLGIEPPPALPFPTDAWEYLKPSVADGEAPFWTKLANSQALSEFVHQWQLARLLGAWRAHRFKLLSLPPTTTLLEEDEGEEDGEEDGEEKGEEGGDGEEDGVEESVEQVQDGGLEWKGSGSHLGVGEGGGMVAKLPKGLALPPVPPPSIERAMSSKEAKSVREMVTDASGQWKDRVLNGGMGGSGSGGSGGGESGGSGGGVGEERRPTIDAHAALESFLLANAPIASTTRDDESASGFDSPTSGASPSALLRRHSSPDGAPRRRLRSVPPPPSIPPIKTTTTTSAESDEAWHTPHDGGHTTSGDAFYDSD